MLRSFCKAKPYASKDSPKQDGFCVVEFKLITASERTMVIARDSKHSLHSFHCNHHCLRLTNSFYFGWCKEEVVDTNEMSETRLQPLLGLATF